MRGLRPSTSISCLTGWLGKVHALHRGVERAEGEWLLFTDADVHFTPTTLRRAIAYVIHQQADHLTLIPRTIQTGLWLDVAVRTFGLLFFLGTRAATINRAGSRAFVGIGAFNLVKAETLSRTPWLGMVTTRARRRRRFGHDDQTSGRHHAAGVCSRRSIGGMVCLGTGDVSRTGKKLIRSRL